MRTDDFDFDLPEDRIALYPTSPRHAARCLVVDPNSQDRLVDGSVWDLIDHLRPGDALVVNNTRVIPAELTGTRTRGDSSVTVHVTLHKRVDPGTWLAFAKPGRRLKSGDTIVFSDDLGADIRARGEGGEIELGFSRSGAYLDRLIQRIGVMPLPTYIASKRAPRQDDAKDYQTVFADREGAVAAPTAGLHFTPELIKRLRDHGVEIHEITLHVGAGTFLPVKVDDIRDHKMHSEWGEVPEQVAAALRAARDRGNRVIAVGTTSFRILETCARSTGRIEPWCGDTDIFITPGFEFNAVDMLLTNFHLPRSTLFILVSAFSGLQTMRAAYAHAVAKDYRFHSFGDACLLVPERSA